MRVEEAKYSILEIANWMRTRELIVNTEYQRAGRLWPRTAKSYFIDTIIKGFPFPKLYFHERIDKEHRRPHREIVDGQQRVGTIVEFIEDKFALSGTSEEFAGLKFSEMSEQEKEQFYSYPVSVDVIRNAERSDILEMFRRMNAYTLPLNEAEKRNCDFFGEFKSWVNTVLDEFGGLFVEWQVLSSRQMLRLLDTEFIADLALAVERGVISTSPKLLRSIYKDSDRDFPERALFDERIRGTLAFIRAEMPFVAQTELTRTHVFFSLICALIHNRWGLPGVLDATDIVPIGAYWTSREAAEIGLRALAAAYEDKDLSRYEEYVKAASEGGNRANQRMIRLIWLCKALRGEVG
jgi:Protein of unknown function DUF262